MLARTQSLKNAAAGLPLGGAKSGLAADPRSAGFETLYRRFVRLVAPALRQNGGPWGGFGFDLGADPIHAEWACDELNSTSCFTGKPVSQGGTDYDAEGIAGLGVVVAATTLLKYQQRPVDSTHCAVQGLGAMGAAVCRYASQEGMEVRFIADPRVGGCWRLESAFTGELRDAVIHGHFEKARSLLELGPHLRMDLDDVLPRVRPWTREQGGHHFIDRPPAAAYAVHQSGHRRSTRLERRRPPEERLGHLLRLNTTQSDYPQPSAASWRR